MHLIYTCLYVVYRSSIQSVCILSVGNSISKTRQYVSFIDFELEPLIWWIQLGSLDLNHHCGGSTCHLIIHLSPNVRPLSVISVTCPHSSSNSAASSTPIESHQIASTFSQLCIFPHNPANSVASPTTIWSHHLSVRFDFLHVGHLDPCTCLLLDCH